MGTSRRKSSARAEEGLLPVLLTATSKSLWCLQVTTVTTATPNNPKVTRQRKYIVSTKGVYRRCFSSSQHLSSCRANSSTLRVSPASC